MSATIASAPAGLMTAEEFFEWIELPENEDGLYELEDGKVVKLSRPNVQHGFHCWLVIHFLTNYILPRGGYILTNDTGLIVKRKPDSVRGPDVMVFLKAPLGIAPETERKPAEHPPALIVEVYSSNDRPGKLNKRIKQYLAKGVPLVWVVYPDEVSVDVFRPGQEAESFDSTETLDGGAALPDLRLPVADLFRLPGAK